MRKPLTTLKRFTRRHRYLDEKLKAYKLTKRGKSLTGEALAALSDHAAMSLKATNASSRIVVAAAADWKFKELLEADEVANLFWVTITPDGMARPIHAAPRFRTDTARGYVALLFEGIDYFGMIDVAYFPKRFSTAKGHERRFYLAGPLVSFHIHLIAWNCCKTDIERLQSEINENSRALFPNRITFYFRPVSAAQARGKNFYQLKSPMSAYSAWTDMTNVSSPITGESVRRPSPNWVVRKRPIRLGEAARIHSALSGFTIPDLMLGGGRGLQLKKDVISVAKARLEFRYFAGIMLTRMRMSAPPCTNDRVEENC